MARKPLPPPTTFRGVEIYAHEPFPRAARMLDGVVSAISPRRGRRRLGDRFRASVGYDIARSGRHRRGYSTAGGSGDQHLNSTTLNRIREWSRGQERNNCIYDGILARDVDNVVGSHFGWRPNTKDPGWNEAAAEIVKTRMAAADAGGRWDFQGWLRMMVRTLDRDGDALGVFDADGRIVTYEADQLATPRDRKASGRRIVNGVELADDGSATAYWVAPRSNNGWVDKSSEAVRIDARDCVFPAYYKRTSQTRGIPILGSGADIFERLDGYLDSETFAAWVNSCLAMFIKKSPEYTDSTSAGPGQEMQANAEGTYDLLQKFDRGMVMDLNVGEEVEAWTPGRPQSNFESYVTAVLRFIGCPIGMPLELILLDFSKTNYSSARGALQQAYRAFQVRQEHVKASICQPSYRQWIGRAVRSGDLTVRDDMFACVWYPPRWPWIDPLKDVMAEERAVAGGMRTLQEIAAREGRNIMELMAERAEELRFARANGIPLSNAPDTLAATDDEEAADHAASDTK